MCVYVCKHTRVHMYTYVDAPIPTCACAKLEEHTDTEALLFPFASSFSRPWPGNSPSLGSYGLFQFCFSPTWRRYHVPSEIAAPPPGCESIPVGLLLWAPEHQRHSGGFPLRRAAANSVKPILSPCSLNNLASWPCSPAPAPCWAAPHRCSCHMTSMLLLYMCQSSETCFSRSPISVFPK